VITTIDTIRALFTYFTAATVAIGGLWSIINTPMEPDTKTIVGAFVGGAFTFLFSAEVSKQATRAQTAASVSGATLHANGLTNSAPLP
jgi:outer membrane lipoprotein SlyB